MGHQGMAMQVMTEKRYLYFGTCRCTHIIPPSMPSHGSHSAALAVSLGSSKDLLDASKQTGLGCPCPRRPAVIDRCCCRNDGIHLVLEAPW